jgi:flagellum-specific ATP synthase
VAPAIASEEVLRAASGVRELLAAWRDARDLIEIDAYVPGTNSVIDRAVACKPAIDAFLRQPVRAVSDLDAALSGLLALAAADGATP